MFFISESFWVTSNLDFFRTKNSFIYISYNDILYIQYFLIYCRGSKNNPW